LAFPRFHHPALAHPPSASRVAFRQYSAGGGAIVTENRPPTATPAPRAGRAEARACGCLDQPGAHPGGSPAQSLCGLRSHKVLCQTALQNSG
jgi:hypothetical protein